MFAKRPTAAAVPRSPALGAGGWMTTLANPYVGAGGAALLFLLSAATLILVAGDPRAGAPSIRIALQSAARLPASGPLRGPAGAPLAGMTGAQGVTLDSLPPGQDVLMPGAMEPAGPAGPTGPVGGPLSAPVSGQAVITLPQGASMGANQASRASGRSAGPPLPAAPLPGLTAPGPGGSLPIIGKDGKTPFQAYARPFKDTGKPRVALVVGGLGLNAAATRAAIERLPAEVTLSFVPYAEGLQGWIDLARADGHEVMLEIPMEPLDYPNNDPGPYTLMASARPEETTKRLEWLLSRATGYFAVTNYLGGRFMTADAGLAAFTGALKSRGLGFIDDGSTPRRPAPGLLRVSADTVVDEQLSAEAVDRQLLSLEAAALQHGQSLGAGFAYPLTVDAVIRWAQGLAGRGYQLAPASALARR